MGVTEERHPRHRLCPAPERKPPRSREQHDDGRDGERHECQKNSGTAVDATQTRDRKREDGHRGRQGDPLATRLERRALGPDTTTAEHIEDVKRAPQRHGEGRGAVGVSGIGASAQRGDEPRQAPDDGDAPQGDQLPRACTVHQPGCAQYDCGSQHTAIGREGGR